MMNDNGRYEFLQSGDEDRDRNFLISFTRRNDRIQKGECPNGCGPMISLSPTVKKCTKCEFVHCVNTIEIR